MALDISVGMEALAKKTSQHNPAISFDTKPMMTKRSKAGVHECVLGIVLGGAFCWVLTESDSPLLIVLAWSRLDMMATACVQVKKQAGNIQIQF
jgi:hypothetical protein